MELEEEERIERELSVELQPGCCWAFILIPKSKKFAIAIRVKTLNASSAERKKKKNSTSDPRCDGFVSALGAWLVRM